LSVMPLGTFRSGSRKKNVKNAANAKSAAANAIDSQTAAAAASTSVPKMNG